MTRLFCFLCGKETETLKEGYCEECFFEKHIERSLPNKTEFVVCSKCKKVKIGNKWTEKPFDQFIIDRFNLGEAEIKQKDPKRIEIIYKTSIGKEIKHIMVVHQNRLMCPVCSRMSGGYYEAIIQIRGNNVESLLKKVDAEIRKSPNPKAFYRLERTRGGVDLYVGSKAVAKSAAENIRKRYELETKKSFTVVTKKEGRGVNRTTILIKN